MWKVVTDGQLKNWSANLPPVVRFGGQMVWRDERSV